MIKHVIILTALVLSLSCDSLLLKESSYVNIEFPENIVKVHIAVFDGDMKPENLKLVTAVLNRRPSFEVPVGEGQTFLFVAENTDGKGQYYFAKSNVSVKSDGSHNLGVIAMVEFDRNDNDVFGNPVSPTDFDYESDTHRFIWKNVGATMYKLYKDADQDSQEPTILFGTTESTSYIEEDLDATYYALVCVYSFFNIESIKSAVYDN